MVQEIFIIDDDNNLKDMAERIFSSDLEYRFKKVATSRLDIALRNIPSLIIINEDTAKEDIINICQKIKENDDNSITPIIVVSSNRDKQHRIKILSTCVEHYILAPVDEDYFYYTVINIIKLLDINRRVSPLTGLPRKCTNTNRNEKKTSKRRSIFYDIFRLR